MNSCAGGISDRWFVEQTFLLVGELPNPLNRAEQNRWDGRWVLVVFGHRLLPAGMTGWGTLCPAPGMEPEPFSYTVHYLELPGLVIWVLLPDSFREEVLWADRQTTTFYRQWTD